MHNFNEIYCVLLWSSHMQMCYSLLHTPTHTRIQQPHTQPQAHSEADKSNALGIVNHNQNNGTNEANVAHINNNGNNNAMRGSVCVCVCAK